MWELMIVIYMSFMSTHTSGTEGMLDRLWCHVQLNAYRCDLTTPSPRLVFQIGKPSGVVA